MGLDQYARLYNPDKVVLDKKTGVETPYCCNDNFWYWRKNRFLNGWMENLYINKCKLQGIQPEEFNCVDLILTREDIVLLEKDIKENKLPDAQGFFWGNELVYTDDNKNEDLEFCRRALEQYDNENYIVYSCWW